MNATDLVLIANHEGSSSIHWLTSRYEDRDPSPDHASRGTFLHVRRAGASDVPSGP
jgi:hypothetical protein